MYDFIRGPLVSISFSVFILGIIFQITRFYAQSRKKDKPVFPLPPRPKRKKAERLSRENIIHRIAVFKTTLFGMHPVMAGISLLFHVCLLLTPLFVLGHNILLDQSWRLSLPSLAERTTDVLTIIVLGGAVFFLLRRIFVRQVRAITSLVDYLVLCLAAAPFLTGFLAYHQLFDYKTVIMLHMLSGELLLMAIPFTKLVHMIFFFINRFVLGGEYSFSRGSRIWQ